MTKIFLNEIPEKVYRCSACGLKSFVVDMDNFRDDCKGSILEMEFTGKGTCNRCGYKVYYLREEYIDEDRVE